MRKKSDKCAVCGGRLANKTIKYDQHWGDQIVVFEDVPARICISCGESWLSARVVKAMDKILTQQKKPKKRIAVPVWSLSMMKAA